MITVDQLETLATRVRDERRRLGLSQAQLGQIIGCKQTAISLIETARVGNPRSQCSDTLYHALREWLGDRYVPVEDGREGMWVLTTDEATASSIESTAIIFAAKIPQSTYQAMRNRCRERDVTVSRFVEEAIGWALIYGRTPGLPNFPLTFGRRRVEM